MDLYATPGSQDAEMGGESTPSSHGSVRGPRALEGSRGADVAGLAILRDRDTTPRHVRLDPHYAESAVWPATRGASRAESTGPQRTNGRDTAPGRMMERAAPSTTSSHPHGTGSTFAASEVPMEVMGDSERGDAMTDPYARVLPISQRSGMMGNVTPMARLVPNTMVAATSTDAGRASAATSTGRLTPGTQFSKASKIWKRREEATRLKKKSSVPMMARSQSAWLQSTVASARAQMQAHALESAKGLEETRKSTEEALQAVQRVQEETSQTRQSVQSQVEQLSQYQQQQQANMAALQQQMQQTRFVATEQSAAQDFARRTGATAMAQEVERQMGVQSRQLQEALQKMEQELQKLKVDRVEKDAQI